MGGSHKFPDKITLHVPAELRAAYDAAGAEKVLKAREALARAFIDSQNEPENQSEPSPPTLTLPSPVEEKAEGILFDGQSHWEASLLDELSTNLGMTEAELKEMASKAITQYVYCLRTYDAALERAKQAEEEARARKEKKSKRRNNNQALLSSAD